MWAGWILSVAWVSWGAVMCLGVGRGGGLGRGRERRVGGGGGGWRGMLWRGGGGGAVKKMCGRGGGGVWRRTNEGPKITS